MTNPFLYGNPVRDTNFIGRKREIQRITNRIETGQSVALVGEPRIGKTSLLTCLDKQKIRTKYYTGITENLIFSFLDTSTFDGEFSQPDFWEYALQPVYDKVIIKSSGSALAESYHICRENNFGNFVIARLLAQFKEANLRLVLLLDEFDQILHHPVLNSAEFFGGLRSVTIHSKDALVLVTASRQSLTNLNADTQDFSRMGSPYFNFFQEITLGAFDNRDVSQLLTCAGNRFSKQDRIFITKIAGEHPYLLQVASSILWDIYDEGGGSASERCLKVAEGLYSQVNGTLANTWRLWPNAMQRAFVLVALPHMALQQRGFYEERLLKDLRDFGPELRILKNRGFIVRDNKMPSGWRVGPEAFMWWLADELVRILRNDPTLKSWLYEHQWNGLVTEGEKDALEKIGQMIGGFIRDVIKTGANTFIETIVKQMSGNL